MKSNYLEELTKIIGTFGLIRRYNERVKKNHVKLTFREVLSQFYRKHGEDQDEQTCDLPSQGGRC